MARRRHTPEQVLAKLRDADVMLANGLPLAEIAKNLEIAEQTYHRWRNQYGGMKGPEMKRLKELEKENGTLKRLVADQALDIRALKDIAGGKLLSPTSRRRAVTHIVREVGLSERSACRLVGQHRTTQRREVTVPRDEPALVDDMRRLSTQHPRFGYRRIHQLLLREGWCVNHKCVQRLWRREGMRVPRKRLKRRPPGKPTNSCILREAESKDHVWTYDFLFERTKDGRQLKILAVVDEYTRECLCTHVARSITGEDVIGVLAAVMMERGVPAHLRSDNGPEFVATAVRSWLTSIGASTLFIQPGSPWENTYIESFNSRFRDELLNGELFVGLAEARYLIENWRVDYNTARPHSSLGYLTPAEFAAGCVPSDSASLRLRAHSPRTCPAYLRDATLLLPQLS
ncbi:MAG: IS3 family transposase [Planctomycetota bacterium]|nr:IS3 family transposase [Planctomycetota bacterium]